MKLLKAKFKQLVYGAKVADTGAGDFSVAHESVPLPCTCAHSVLTDNVLCRTPGLRPADVLFRLFDILKPWPVSALERGVPGAWGVMLDDVAAGAMAGGCMTAVLTAIAAS